MKVVIIGGGIMGMSVALELAQGGHDVTVLEKSVPGAEASSAAAGLLAPQLEAQGPGPLLDLCLASRALYPAWVKKLEALSGVEVGYLESGVLEVAFTADQRSHLQRTLAWQRAAGLECDWLEDPRAVEPAISLAALGALHFPHDHQVDPPKLMRALPIAASKAGATFRSGHVRGIVEAQGRARGVDLDGERLDADAVVVAAGSWSSGVAGARIDARVLKPMRGQMVELRTRLPISRHALSSPDVYLVPRADGRLVAGSTQELVGFDKRVTAEGVSGILNAAIALCPALGAAEAHSTWAGLRPWTEDQLPILGEGPLPGLLLATGHFRNGILLAPVTAQVIARLLQGESTGIETSHFRYGRFPS